MIMFSLLRVSFYLSIIIILWVLFALFWGNLGKLIKKWKKSDIDIKIVSLFPIILFVVLLIAFDLYDPKERGYMPLIPIMIQLFAITLASAAAIIAFRNYRRKSGAQISYVMSDDLDHAHVILLRNDKDKSIPIFAIDVLLINEQRIRLVDFVNSGFDPIILSPFEIRKLDIKKVHLYGSRRFGCDDVKAISKVIFITDNGEVNSQKFAVPALNDDFKKNDMLRAYRIQNIPDDYKGVDVDIDTEYWIHIAEESLEEHHYFCRHVLTGYIQNDVFFLTNSSLKYIGQGDKKPLKKYCLNKIHNQKIFGEYSSRNMDYYDSDGSYLVNGLFEPDMHRNSDRSIQGFNLFSLDKVEKIEINNMH